MDFSGKYVLVTGGSRGIGRAIVTDFAKRGAILAIHYNKNKDAAQQTLDSIPGTGHILVQAEMADANAVNQMVETVVNSFGALDIVVNNAGIYKPHPLQQVDYRQWQDLWQETMAVNLTGPANLCYSAAQYMKKSGGGRIVNVSSRGAFRGEPEAPAYGASKAALNAMSQSLAKQLAKDNIFVAVVAPGFVETDMAEEFLDGPEGDFIRNQSPLGRVARPEEVAHAVVFLASEGAQFMTGTIVDVNGASYLRS